MKLLFLIISMLLVTAVCAQNTAKDDILANYKLSGSNICTYIEPTNVTYTNAPNCPYKETMMSPWLC